MNQITEDTPHPAGLGTQLSTPFDQQNRLPKLTRKQKVFVKEMLDNPKISATEAAARAYNVSNRVSAGAIAAENLQKPQILSHLENHVELFESTLVDTVREWGRSQNSRQRELALDAAKFGHDKIFGRAAQKVDLTEKKLVVHIDLTG